VPGAAVRVAVGVRPPRSSVGAGSVASSCCRGSQCQPQPSGLTFFLFVLKFNLPTNTWTIVEHVTVNLPSCCMTAMVLKCVPLTIYLGM
jgi:hypothetical protein